MSDNTKGKTNVLKRMACAGLSGCVTECVALPFDTIKARLMMDESKGISFLVRQRKTVQELWKEGPSSFLKGLSAGLHRQILFASTRIGLFEAVIVRFII